MPVAVRPPTQMLGYQQRIKARDEALQFGKMALAQAIGRAEGEADAVQAERVIAPYMLEHVQVVAAGAEVILAMYFQPADARTFFEEMAVMRGAEPYARK